MFEQRSFEQKSIAILVSLLFAILFVTVRWEAVFGQEFEDRTVYLFMFQGKPDFDLEFNKDTFFFYLFNEQLWNKGVRFLNTTMGLTLLEIFSGVSFLVAFSYCYFVTSRVGLFGVIFICNPLFVDLAYSQLRMAAAMVLLLLVFNLKSTLIRLILLSAVFFIHTASFLFVVIYLMVHCTIKISERYNLKGFMSCLLLTFSGFIVACFVGPLRVMILEVLGDRRVKYEADASGWAYSSIWLLILAVSFIQKREFFRNYTNAVAITFISVFIFCTAFSVYGLRFLSAALPFIFVLLCRFGPLERPLMILVFLMFSIFQWVYWMR
jgi:hypothetical protein